MNPMARIRRRKDVPLVEVYTDGDFSHEPDLVCTTIIMGIAPPEARGPGFACVVAEIYDGDPMQRERQKIILDGDVALNPRDFVKKLSRRNRAERARFQAMGATPTGVVPGRVTKADVCEEWKIDESEYSEPTLYSLQRAAVCLKDLYEPEFAVAPRIPHFLARLRYTDGLGGYDEEQKQHWPRWFPCKPIDTRFADSEQPRGWEIGVLGDESESERPPENRDYQQWLLDTLVSRELLKVDDRLNKSIWNAHEDDWPSLKRAAGLALVEMESYDSTFIVRRVEHPDGYAERSKEEQEEIDKAAKSWDDMLADLEFQMSGRDPDSRQKEPDG